MKQVARNLTDPLDGFLRAKRYLLMDRDTKYGQAFRAHLEQAGVTCVRLPARSPNLTPHIERFMRTIKEECLGRMIFFGQNSLPNAVHEFLVHYHRERNHQGLENTLIDPGDAVGELQGKMECRERLGGMLRYYYRQAIEIQQNGVENQHLLNQRLIGIGHELAIPLVATNDCHYLHKKDAKAHEVLLCIQTGKTLQETQRMRFASDQFYFRSPEEMAELFADCPEAVANTVAIADYDESPVRARTVAAPGGPLYKYVPADTVSPAPQYGGEALVRFTGSTHDERAFITKTPAKVAQLNEHLRAKIENHPN